MECSKSSVQHFRIIGSCKSGNSNPLLGASFVFRLYQNAKNLSSKLSWEIDRKNGIEKMWFSQFVVYPDSHNNDI